MSAIPVVYADRWLLVVDKPAGMPTQASPGGPPDLYALLKADEPALALHHRLDQSASGLVLFVRDPAANKAIAQGFRDHTIRRTYRAVLNGDANDAIWDRPLEGQAARTEVRVVGRGAATTAVAIDLHTGRMHQIRRHAAMAGRAVLGDRRYGAEAGALCPRLALHAWRLTLDHPIQRGVRLSLEAPLPDDLAEAWSAAGGS